ncbi:MAG: TatD family hydrolase [Bacteroidaceae bacterium]|nr:TatD family hydrolase [Bacteroidaceae bacterium]
MLLFDHHTHNLQAPAGQAVICLPRAVVAQPDTFQPRAGARYSVGVHPWWVSAFAAISDDDVATLLEGTKRLAARPEVTAIGEVGFDRHTGYGAVHDLFFEAHAQLAATYHKPLIIHCVKAFDRLLFWRKQLPRLDDAPWYVHGFRGKPALARQLLEAGIGLLFGPQAQAETLRLFRPDELRLETDDSGLTIEEVAQRISYLLGSAGT